MTPRARATDADAASATTMPTPTTVATTTAPRPAARRPAVIARAVPHTVRTAMIMGLPFSIHLRAAAKPAEGVASGSAGTDISPEFEALVDVAVDAVWRRLRESDRIFSTYRSDSDISRINRRELAVRDADAAVAQVLDFAEIARRLTGGAFDITGGGTLDPSGIVKGWAASHAVERLDALGVDYYLNAGGDVLLRSRSAGRTWRIGIEHPDDPQGLLAVVELANGAVATSGRAHRGEHIWDPATGEPARGITQATVVGPSLVWADVLATAVVAGGPARLDPAQWPPGNEVLFVTDDGRVMASAGFQALFAPGVPAPPVTVLR